MANQFDQDLLVDDPTRQDTLEQDKLGQDSLAPQDASDSEWEYEYDATESEVLALSTSCTAYLLLIEQLGLLLHARPNHSRPPSTPCSATPKQQNRIDRNRPGTRRSQF